MLALRSQDDCLLSGSEFLLIIISMLMLMLMLLGQRMTLDLPAKAIHPQ